MFCCNEGSLAMPLISHLLIPALGWINVADHQTEPPLIYRFTKRKLNIRITGPGPRQHSPCMAVARRSQLG